MTTRKIVCESQTFNNIERRRELLISYDLEIKVSGEPTEIRCNAWTAGREKENTTYIMYIQYIKNSHKKK